MRPFYNSLKSVAKHHGLFSTLSLFVPVLLSAQVYTTNTIMDNGPKAKRINLVYMGDGYLQSEQPNFITNATLINNQLFNQTPFKEYWKFFNVFAIQVPSPQSGAKHPGTASDEASAGVGHPISNPTTAFNHTFDFAGIHRLVATSSTTPMYNVLAANVPEYDQAFVVVNSTFYGGAGGPVATSTVHQSAGEISIHEIGHSFAGLADEYWAGSQYASERPNMTQDNNPATNKWKSWLNINNTGIFAYGPSFPQSQWYRPHQLCKMQYLGYPFCSVCTERFVDRFHQLINMVDDYLPATTAFAITNTSPVDFSITPLLSTPSTMTVNWYLNGTLFATGTNNISIPFSSWLVSNNNEVKAEVVDNTILSKSYVPGAGFVNSVSWTVSNGGVLPVNLVNFTGKLNMDKSATLDWQVADGDVLSHIELERSADGTGFSKVARIQATSGQTRFSQVDREPPAPWVFYRLSLVGKSGNQKYSQVVRLSNPIDKFVYKVYQDPQARKYHLAVKLTNPERVEANMYTLDGREIWKHNFGRVETSLDYDIFPGIIQSGIYLLNLRIGESRYSIRLVAE